MWLCMHIYVCVQVPDCTSIYIYTVSVKIVCVCVCMCVCLYLPNLMVSYTQHRAIDHLLQVMYFINILAFRYVFFGVVYFERVWNSMLFCVIIEHILYANVLSLFCLHVTVRVFLGITFQSLLKLCIQLLINYVNFT